MSEQEPRHILLLSGGKDSTALALYMHDNYPEIDLEYVFMRAALDVKIKHIQRYNGMSHLRWWLQGRNRGDGFEGDLRKSPVGRLYGRLLGRRSDTLWAVGGIK